MDTDPDIVKKLKYLNSLAKDQFLHFEVVPVTDDHNKGKYGWWYLTYNHMSLAGPVPNWISGGGTRLETPHKHVMLHSIDVTTKCLEHAAKRAVLIPKLQSWLVVGATSIIAVCSFIETWQ